MTNYRTAKAKKLETYYDKYYTTIVYEYRGHNYEVTYGNGSGVCCTPAWIQHRDEQEKIDRIIDNPEPQKETEPINLDEIWEVMGW